MTFRGVSSFDDLPEDHLAHIENKDDKSTQINLGPRMLRAYLMRDELGVFVSIEHVCQQFQSQEVSYSKAYSTLQAAKTSLNQYLIQWRTEQTLANTSAVPTLHTFVDDILHRVQDNDWYRLYELLKSEFGSMTISDFISLVSNRAKHSNVQWFPYETVLPNRAVRVDVLEAVIQVCILGVHYRKTGATATQKRLPELVFSPLGVRLLKQLKFPDYGRSPESVVEQLRYLIKSHQQKGQLLYQEIDWQGNRVVYSFLAHQTGGRPTASLLDQEMVNHLVGEPNKLEDIMVEFRFPFDSDQTSATLLAFESLNGRALGAFICNRVEQEVEHGLIGTIDRQQQRQSMAQISRIVNYFVSEEVDTYDLAQLQQFVEDTEEAKYGYRLLLAIILLAQQRQAYQVLSKIKSLIKEFEGSL